MRSSQQASSMPNLNDPKIASIGEISKNTQTRLKVWSNGLNTCNSKCYKSLQTSIQGFILKSPKLTKLGLIACLVALQQHSKGFFFNFSQNTKQINHIFEYPLWSTLTYQKERVGCFGKYMTVLTM